MAKIFDGKKAVNISADVYEQIAKIAAEKRLYPSQLIDQILVKFLEKGGKDGQNKKRNDD